MKSLAEQATDRVNDLIKLINEFRDDVSQAKRDVTVPEVQVILTNLQVRMMTINTDLQGLRATVAAARMTHGLDGQRPQMMPDAEPSANDHQRTHEEEALLPL